MTTQTHKPGIHENYLVTRRLKLEGLDPSSIEPLVAQLGALAPVDAVSITLKRNRPLLKISYDASLRRHPLEEIKQLLTAGGGRIADDWWTRLKLRNYTVTDQNIYDNARYEPSCCSKAPPGK